MAMLMLRWMRRGLAARLIFRVGPIWCSRRPFRPRAWARWTRNCSNICSTVSRDRLALRSMFKISTVPTTTIFFIFASYFSVHLLLWYYFFFPFFSSFSLFLLFLFFFFFFFF